MPKDPLSELFLLYERELSTADRMAAGYEANVEPKVSGAKLTQALDDLSKDLKSSESPRKRKKPELNDNESANVESPNKNNLEHPEVQRKKAIETEIRAGVPADVAHQNVSGPVDTRSTRSRAAFAQTLGKVEDDKKRGAVRIEKGGGSLLAQDDEIQDELDQVTPDDLRTKQGKELPDELQGGDTDTTDTEQDTPTDPEVQTNTQQVPTEVSPEQEREQQVRRIERQISNSYSEEEVKAVRTNKQPELTPQQQEQNQQSKDFILSTLETMLTQPKMARGAGKYDLSDDDISIFQNYIKNGMHKNVTRMTITDDDVSFAWDYLKSKYKGKEWTSVLNSLKGKGDPPSEMKTVSRAKDVLRSYLEYGGLSAVTGEPLPMKASQLDHITSLNNGGVDGGDNWAWLETRFNQVKRDLEDEELLEKLQKLAQQNPDDKKLKQMEKDLRNSIRGEWNQYFRRKGWDNITQADILEAKGTNGMQKLKALAEVAGISHYKDRGKTRSSGRAGGGASLSIDELKSKLIDELNIPSEEQLDKFDEDIIQVLQVIEDKSSELDTFKKSRRKKKSKKTVRECYLEWILETRFDYFINPDKITYLEEEREDLTEEELPDTMEDVDYLRFYGRA